MYPTRYVHSLQWMNYIRWRLECFLINYFPFLVHKKYKNFLVHLHPIWQNYLNCGSSNLAMFIQFFQITWNVGVVIWTNYLNCGHSKQSCMKGHLNSIYFRGLSWIIHRDWCPPILLKSFTLIYTLIGISPQIFLDLGVICQSLK